MIKVTNEISIYEVEGKALETTIGDPKLKINSHWNNPDRVEMEFDGKKITILARELKVAIDNATNTARHY